MRRLPRPAGERIRRASPPRRRGADPRPPPPPGGFNGGVAPVMFTSRRAVPARRRRPRPPVSPAPLPLGGARHQQAAEDGDVEPLTRPAHGKAPRPGKRHCGESKSDGSGRPTIAAERRRCFRPCFSQGAAQRRLKPSRPGAEALALPKTKHPGPDIPRWGQCRRRSRQTLGGVRHASTAAPDAASGSHLSRLAHSTRKRTVLSTFSTISAALTRPAV